MKKIQISTFLALLIMVMSQSFAQVSSQWRGFDRSGIYPDTNLLEKWPAEGPKMLWHFDDLGKGFSSPVISSEGIFITGMVGDSGFVFRLDLKGKQVWKTKYDLEWTESWVGARATPTLVDNKLYLISSFGLALCVDAHNGKILWRVDMKKDFGAQVIKWGITEMPLILGDNVIFTPGGSEVTMVALNRLTGKEVWRCKGNGEASAYCSPLYVEYKGKKLIITHSANNIIGVDATNGKFLWSSPKTNDWSVHPNTPTFKDGMIYCLSGYASGGVMLKLADDCASVSMVWKNTSLDNQMGGCILLDGKIYGSGQKDKSWQCLDRATGAVKYTSKEVGNGNIISADGLLYFYNGDKGDLALVKPTQTAFQVISRFKITLGSEAHWAHPVINKGVLYIRHGNALMAFDIKK